MGIALCSTYAWAFLSIAPINMAFAGEGTYMVTPWVPLTPSALLPILHATALGFKLPGLVHEECKVFCSIEGIFRLVPAWQMLQGSKTHGHGKRGPMHYSCWRHLSEPPDRW